MCNPGVEGFFFIVYDDVECNPGKTPPAPKLVATAGAAYRGPPCNRAAFGRWRFVPRMLVDVSKRSQSVELFGVTHASPVGIAPMGVSGLCCFDGDVALARAAVAAGVPSVLSAASTVPLERVMAEAPGTWYQAYLPAQKEVIGPLLERLKAAGVGVLVLTLDVQVASVRENEVRNGFSVPLRFTPKLVIGGMLLRPRVLILTIG